MLKLILFIGGYFITIPLSAQADSGYFSCHSIVKELIKKFELSELEQEDFRIKYDMAQKECEDCIKKYRVPDFKAKTINNDSISLSSFENKVIVINFWSLNCPPCLVEIPVLDKLSKEYSNKNIIFISLTLSVVGDRMKKYISNFATVENAKTIFDLYGVVGYPQTLVLRKNHFLQHRFMGIDTNNIDGFKNEIKIQIDKALTE